jgi:hypothetical protein
MARYWSEPGPSAHLRCAACSRDACPRTAAVLFRPPDYPRMLWWTTIALSAPCDGAQCNVRVSTRRERTNAAHSGPPLELNRTSISPPAHVHGRYLRGPDAGKVDEYETA